MPNIDVIVVEKAGGAAYSAATTGKLVKKVIDGADLAGKLEAFLATIKDSKLFQQTLGGLAVESITLNIAISVEGGISIIGLATAGAEASLSVTLKPK